MPKDYITTPSENFAERENQMWNYHPDLCRKLGEIHAGYGWSPVPRSNWDDDQIAAYKEGHRNYPGLRG